MNESAPTPRQPSYREDAVEIIRRLREAGHVAYLAGGCVRDELLGLQPKDFDVATDATPDRVRALFPKSQAIGAAFGVILVRYGRSMIEVATFRTDGAYSDGRRPDNINFTDAQHDALRRDFTINGLFFDPIENKVIDFVGGQDDLRSRIIRAIGDPEKRFAEDYLRLLRAARFSARFKFDIEERTRVAMKTYAPKLAQISPERICEELRLMLTAESRGEACERLIAFGMLDIVTRFARESSEELGPDFHPDAFFNLDQRTVSFALALGALGLDIMTQVAPHLADHLILSRESCGRYVRGMRKSLRISNEETERLAAILRVGELLDPRAFPTIAAMKRFLAIPASADARILLSAIARVTPPVRQRIAEIEAKFAELEQTDVAPPPLVTGDDLIAAGLTPGPAFKKILEWVYDEQLEGRLTTREEALKRAIES